MPWRFKACSEMVKINKRGSGLISTSPFSLISPMQRIDHHAAGKGKSPERLSRKTLVCSCGDSFSVGAPLPDDC